MVSFGGDVAAKVVQRAMVEEDRLAGRSSADGIQVFVVHEIYHFKHECSFSVVQI